MSNHDNSRSVGVAWAIFFAVVLIGMYLLATPARPQTPPVSCGKTADIEKFLRSDYKETPAYVGVSQGGSPVLIFTNPEKQTFTVVMRKPNGVSCMMVAGINWTEVEQPKKGTDL